MPRGGGLINMLLRVVALLFSRTDQLRIDGVAVLLARRSGRPMRSRLASNAPFFACSRTGLPKECCQT